VCVCVSARVSVCVHDRGECHALDGGWGGRAREKARGRKTFTLGTKKIICQISYIKCQNISH
jgi:hypothetical protein